MKRIGIISDTHSWWDEKYAHHFAGCDEIWHAGDIGSPLIIKHLENICPVRAVCGNIDGNDLKLRFNRILRFKIEECNVMITHIGGYPGKYAPEIRAHIYHEKPDLFVAGHSHILKVMYDKSIDCFFNTGYREGILLSSAISGGDSYSAGLYCREITMDTFFREMEKQNFLDCTYTFYCSVCNTFGDGLRSGSF